MALHFHCCVKHMLLGAPRCFQIRGATISTAPMRWWALAEVRDFHVTLKHSANFPVSLHLPDTTRLSLSMAK